MGYLWDNNGISMEYDGSQWPFQEPKVEVPTTIYFWPIFEAYVREYP